ncbi:lasso peptide biosynthesis PqqD family chaperone [Bailinhaonella thermotolerans]|uniref:Lasso peptide biosynthesis PqqD family chaperone n=1 Tax=Bailinhaonella thermotolerans TaxID=1070861 RepID=A0A3A4ASG1_9ACTN|nr:lasso peptide biosynthesis PqqD family chaperone [Bailinhaonella thermotolerans]RJL31265.1 lasso peptide biosynthesis PqqD family chaperone [Bailinhaonella thermotolerans]
MSLRLGADVTTAETDYGMVLLDQRSGDYWQLNPTGALVVRRLLAGDPPERAAAALAEEFGVGLGEAAADVRDLLEELRAAGLVTS